jgi:hypothetical protein
MTAIITILDDKILIAPLRPDEDLPDADLPDAQDQQPGAPPSPDAAAR